MEEIFRLPACIGDRAQPLRRLYDKMMVHIRGLKSLGIETTQYGSVLIPVLMSKLPDGVRLERIERKPGRLITKSRLGLSPIREEKLNLNTFSDSKFKTQICDVVRVY